MKHLKEYKIFESRGYLPSIFNDISELFKDIVDDYELELMYPTEETDDLEEKQYSIYYHEGGDSNLSWMEEEDEQIRIDILIGRRSKYRDNILDSVLSFIERIDLTFDTKSKTIVQLSGRLRDLDIDNISKIKREMSKVNGMEWLNIIIENT